MPQDQLAKPDVVLDAPGLACVTLTPLIKQQISEMPSGSLLEVRTDDPSAREGVPAWSRLTGNPLVQTVEEDARHTTFLIRRK